MIQLSFDHGGGQRGGIEKWSPKMGHAPAPEAASEAPSHANYACLCAKLGRTAIDSDGFLRGPTDRSVVG
jgi:hypothetical protein